MAIVVTAVAALSAGYLLGRLRPWRRLGDWAADQVCFTGAWVQGGTGRQAVVILVHVVTAPRTSWRIMRAPATACGGAPARRLSMFARLGGGPSTGRVRARPGNNGWRLC
ncbi:hypothetical protein OHA79_44565 (plasmid) [Streptomyces sp. NBC_00841]|uniref:hypothetical protein n=1 Tax=Streptomyces sp. NBC_00841 TaxID=2975847 RepID=UPI002DDAA29F|nr:hypothetical protein [Streptomyces sp. NBC_00841]WSA04759.1 hypothetical protein OHA79_44565 [Streptomyces sp. NBC_00841]